jgi:hypothetical protein
MNWEEIYESIGGDYAIEQRAKAAQEKARKIINGEVETVDDLVRRMMFILSKHYNIPFFSEFLETLTLDQLFLEISLITEKEKTPEQKTSEMIVNNRSELESLFDDMEDPNVPLDLTEEEKQSIRKEGEDFFKNGFVALTEEKQGE